MVLPRAVRLLSGTEALSAGGGSGRAATGSGDAAMGSSHIVWSGYTAEDVHRTGVIMVPGYRHPTDILPTPYILPIPYRHPTDYLQSRNLTFKLNRCILPQL